MSYDTCLLRIRTRLGDFKRDVHLKCTNIVYVSWVYQLNKHSKVSTIDLTFVSISSQTMGPQKQNNWNSLLFSPNPFSFYHSIILLIKFFTNFTSKIKLIRTKTFTFVSFERFLYMAIRFYNYTIKIIIIVIHKSIQTYTKPGILHKT